MESHELKNNAKSISVTLSDAFYDKLRSGQFETKEDAILVCRKLCADYGFTVKQESSGKTGSIYVYCSREGAPDSQRNPNTTRIRKRVSKRCHCRWRIVLNKRGSTWRFRTFDLREANLHNHELLKPQDIEQVWPQEMLDQISELAKTNLRTADIRAQVQSRFSNLKWNERRFYNRLTSERQKKRKQDTLCRARALTEQFAKISIVATVSQNVFEVAQQQLSELLTNICEMSNVDPNTISLGDLFGGHEVEIQDAPDKDNARGNTASSQDETEGKKLRIRIPEHSFEVSLPGQRAQPYPARRRSRSVLTTEEDELSQGPARKKQINTIPMVSPSRHPSPSQEQDAMSTYSSPHTLYPPNVSLVDAPHLSPYHAHGSQWSSVSVKNNNSPLPVATPSPNHTTQLLSPTTAVTPCVSTFPNTSPLGRNASPTAVQYGLYDAQAHRRRSSSSSNSQLSGQYPAPEPHYSLMPPKTTPSTPFPDMTRCGSYPLPHKFQPPFPWPHHTMETTTMPTTVVYESMPVYSQPAL